MEKKKLQKGEYGYLKKRQHTQILKVLIMALIIIGILVTGIIIYKTKNNILTVLAILVVLPAAKMLVNCIMLCRYKATGQEEYEKISAYEDRNKICYDMVLCAKDKIFNVKIMTVSKKDVLIYTEDKLNNKEEIEKYIASFVRVNGHSIHVKIINDKNMLYKHLEHGKLPEEDISQLLENLLILHI